MVKKFINATINMALDKEKTLQKWADECASKNKTLMRQGRCVRCKQVCIL